MIKILRQDRMSIYMTFDAKGNDKLISAFANILKNQICELNVTFDLSVINMKRTKLKDVSIILKIDNSIKRSVFFKSNKTIIWAMDKDDADFGLESFVDCKKMDAFFWQSLLGCGYRKIRN